MNELGLWIKQLILIVFLAILSDFLLPTQAMQKYVRVVMGLAIIAVMIQPIIPLVGHNWADQVANQAVSEIFGGSTAPDSIQSQRFDAFTNELVAQQQAEASQLAEARLVSQIEAVCGCTVDSVQIDGLSSASVKSIIVRTPSATNGKVTRQIITFVASELGIGTDHIQVEPPSQGGASNGF